MLFACFISGLFVSVAGGPEDNNRTAAVKDVSGPLREPVRYRARPHVAYISDVPFSLVDNNLFPPTRSIIL